MHDKLHLTLFGAPQITWKGIPVTGFISNKARALLIYLAVTGCTHSRDALAELLWADTPATRRANLRKTLNNLRNLDGVALIEGSQQLVALDLARCWVDVAEFEQLANRAAFTSDVDTLQRAVQCYKGDFLAGFNLSLNYGFETWALSEQARLKMQMVEMLRRLADEFAQRNELPQAIAAVRHLLQLEPWREEAHRQLMAWLAYQGERSAALAQFEICRQRLLAELDVEPSAATVALAEKIQRNAFDKPNDFRLVTFPPGQVSPTSPLYDLLEAPDIGPFFGRESELTQLHQWLSSERCRVVAILGMGGIGKTSLAVKAIDALIENNNVPGLSRPRFDKILWRSLLNAPPLTDILRQLIQLLSEQQIVNLPPALDEQLRLFVNLLQQQRTLVVLDNVESIMQTGTRAGRYRDGYIAYGQLWQRVAQTEHRSCLFLTSRECPQELQRLAYDSAHVQLMELAGLPVDAGHDILKTRGITAQDDSANHIIARYSGNPLALKLVAETIQDLYGGSLDAFRRDEVLIFDDIRDVLDQQFARLSTMEQEILIWLAIEREPVSTEILWQNLVRPNSKGAFLEALRSLQRRSLVEGRTMQRTLSGNIHDVANPGGEEGFTLQNVVTEYISNHLVITICEELETGTLNYFNRYALLKPQAKDYVRESQKRLLLDPVAGWMKATFGEADAAERLNEILAIIHVRQLPAPGYAGGNLLNLLFCLADELHALDFSNLTIWQANLQGKRLFNVNFTQADLCQTLFTDAFGAIVSVAMSPDGQLIAAGTARGEIRIWQRKTGQLCCICEGHDSYVWSVCFSPDGSRLASGGVDHAVRLWDMRDVLTLGIAPCVKTLRGHTAWVNAVAFSPGGEFLASGGDDQAIYLWEIDTGKCQTVLTGHTNPVRSVCFSPDGLTLASGSADRTVRLWQIDAELSARTTRYLRILHGHDGWVNAVCFSDDGHTLFSGSDDQSIQCWRVSDGQRLQSFYQPTGSARTLALNPGSTILASAGSSNSVYLWDVQTAKHLQTCQGHTSQIRSICFSPDGSTLISGADDQSIRQWDIRSGQCIQTLQGYSSGIWAISFSPDGTYLACGGEDRGVRLWQVTDTTVRVPYHKIFWDHTSYVHTLAFSTDGRLLASGGSDRQIRLWDVPGGYCRQILQGHTQKVYALCFDPKGGILASGGVDKTLRVWNIHTGECLRSLEAHTSFVRAVVFSPNGTLLTSAGDDLTIRLWNMDAIKNPATSNAEIPTQTLSGHRSWITALAWRPDNRIFASSSADATIRLWDVTRGQCLCTYEGHNDCVRSIAFSPDGQILASGSYDQTIRLWSLKTGQTTHRLEGHQGWIRSIFFHPGGKYMASSSEDATIKLWNVATGACMATVPVEGPYAGMNITNASGLTSAQRTALKALGAVDLSE